MKPARNVIRLARLRMIVSMCWSTFLSGTKQRNKNESYCCTAIDTITQFIFCVIKEVSLDIDGKITTRFLLVLRCISGTWKNTRTHPPSTCSAFSNAQVEWQKHRRLVWVSLQTCHFDQPTGVEKPKHFAGCMRCRRNQSDTLYCLARDASQPTQSLLAASTPDRFGRISPVLTRVFAR